MEGIEEKDSEILLRSAKVAEQVISLVRDECDDTSQLDEELSGNVHFEAYVDKISDSDRVKVICENYDRVERDSEVARFSVTIKQRRRRLLRKKAIIWSSSVAAAIISISFIIYSIKPNGSDVITKNETAEVVIKPTLILNCGEIIELNGDSKTDLILAGAIADTQDSTEEVVAGDVVYSKIVIPSKYTYCVTLSDGTKVMLNANSTLRFPKKFNADKRVVYLEGEAYFEVAKSTIPFCVDCENITLRVYGTQFNVKNCKSPEVVLVEGSVGVKMNGADNEYMLKPSQRLTVNASGVEIVNVEVDKYLAWQNNCFIAESDEIVKLLSDISQWYGVKFNHSDKIDLNKRISVQINRDMVLDELLEALSSTLNMIFIKEKEGVYYIDRK